MSVRPVQGSEHELVQGLEQEPVQRLEQEPVRALAKELVEQLAKELVEQLAKELGAVESGPVESEQAPQAHRIPSTSLGLLCTVDYRHRIRKHLLQNPEGART